MPAAGLPLYITFPCTLPMPGAGLTFSTPVSAGGAGVAFAAAPFAFALEFAVAFAFSEPPPAQPVSESAAMVQAQEKSLMRSVICASLSSSPAAAGKGVGMLVGTDV